MGEVIEPSKRWTFRAPAEPRLFEAMGEQRVGRTVCFLCGRRLRRGSRSTEHVFPKWLQRRFNLWDQKLTLLNGSDIQYRKLTIPCCRTCNSAVLAPIEKAVERATARGPSAVRSLSKRTLYLWLAKILYGILYKEGLLRTDQRNPKAGRLVRRTTLRGLEMHHRFLQGSRVPMRFLGFFPASIFVFRLQKPANRKFQFNFRDSPVALALAFQLGSVGIVGALQDGGAQETGFADYLNRYQRFALHPLQFLELVAHVFYKAALFNRTPKYLTMEGSKALQVIQLPLQGFSARPVYDEWSQEMYARILSFHTGLPLERVYAPPDRVATWLNGPDGEPRYFNLRDQPWYPDDGTA